MIAYKMMKLRKNGTLGSLFINASAVIPIGKWLEAEPHRKKGFAFRPGWHCCFEQNAPHLKLTDDRVWVKVEIKDWVSYDRPMSQGGAWILAEKIKVIEIIREPRFKYDCDRCKYNWCCGYVCACVYPELDDPCEEIKVKIREAREARGLGYFYDDNEIELEK